MNRNISAERLVNAGQALAGYFPRPTPTEIDDILARLAKALDVPFTTESDAKLLWRQRVGLSTRHETTNGEAQCGEP